MREIKGAEEDDKNRPTKVFSHSFLHLFFIIPSALHLLVSVVESYVYTDSLFNVQSQCSTSKKDLISPLHKLAQTWVLMRNRETGAFNPLFCPNPHTSRTSYILHRYTLINTKIRTYISTRTDTSKHNHMRKMIVQRNTKIFTEHFHCI